MSRIFPVALILLQCGASVLCVLDGDWRRGVYWLAAAVLTVVVTF